MPPPSPPPPGINVLRTLKKKSHRAPAITPHATPRRAFVTLLSETSYLPGVIALHSSLTASESAYPLVVIVTAAVPPAVRGRLEALARCEVREVAPPDLPAGAAHYACAHFAHCWTKLRMWEWEDEFSRLCYLDADMLLLKNCDELLGDRLCGGAALHAVPECSCVSGRSGGCPYLSPPAGAPPAHYFNAGLLVLSPCRATAEAMRAALAASDLASFAFAEQDFLNRYFAHDRGAAGAGPPCSWRALPWCFNATKGLYARHRGLCRLGEVRILHFTMAKPWDLRHPCHAGFERLNALWHAAFADPASLPRATLRAVLQEKRERESQGGGV